MKTAVAFMWAAALLFACGTAPAPAAPTLVTALPHSAQATPGGGLLKVVIVPSELVVGPNRFAVGLFNAADQMVLQAQVHFRYFDLSEPNTPVVESDADAERLATPEGTSAIFAQERNFDRAGDWGVEVQARFPDGTTGVKRVAFKVAADSATVTPGQKAPSFRTPTAADVGGDLSLLTSAATPDPAFYRLSLDQAVASGKPTVLLFATPAFCQSRLCGPAYEVIGQVRKDFGDSANFIHIEVYAGLPNPAAENWQVTPAMQAFGLSSEPWVFFIDRSGTVVYRIEGLVTAAEIERHLKPLVVE